MSAYKRAMCLLYIPPLSTTFVVSTCDGSPGSLVSGWIRCKVFGALNPYVFKCYLLLGNVTQQRSISPYTWYRTQYCHSDYDNDPKYTGGVDICGDREIEGFAIIGK